MTHALRDADYVPEVIGADVQFLLDGSDGEFRVMFIKDMIEMIERDAFYPDERSPLQDGAIYMLRRGALPQTMHVAYRIYRYAEEWIYKTMEISTSTGELIAQAGYKIPTLKGYETWKAR